MRQMTKSRQRTTWLCNSDDKTDEFAGASRLLAAGVEELPDGEWLSTESVMQLLLDPPEHLKHRTKGRLFLPGRQFRKSSTPQQGEVASILHWSIYRLKEHIQLFQLVACTTFWKPPDATDDEIKTADNVALHNHSPDFQFPNIHLELSVSQAGLVDDGSISTVSTQRNCPCHPLCILCVQCSFSIWICNVCYQHCRLSRWKSHMTSTAPRHSSSSAMD